MKLRLAIKPGAVTVVCALLLFGATAAASPPSGFVTAQGTTLYLDGQPYRPVGINIYNANSNGWCWYAMDGNVLGDSLTALGGSINVFRAWFFQQLAVTNAQRDWTAFDRTLDAAHAHGLKVIVTLIDQWGNCGSSSVPGGYKDVSWYETGYTQTDPAGIVSYRDWVEEVVARYKDDPTILMWQLINEAEVKPSAESSSCSINASVILKSFAADVSDRIKAIDPNHLVSLGTIGSGQCGASGDEYADVHSLSTIDLCEFHDYGAPFVGIPGDQWNGLQRRLDQCGALDKPLFVGELGIRPNDVGGTFQARADAVASKLCAQFTAGVAGELPWAWNKDGSLLDNYDIGPSDPVLGVLAPWTDAAHGCSPTAVRIHSFSARGDGLTTLLRWRTASDAGILGFNVYRDHDGNRVRLNRTLISSVVRENGHTYSWRDRRATRGARTLTYRLQAVSLDGMRSWVSAAAVAR